LKPPQLAASLTRRCFVLLDANAVANHSADSGQDDRRWYTESAAESCYPYSTNECSDERAHDHSIDRPAKLSRPRLSKAANRVGTAFDCMLHFFPCGASVGGLFHFDRGTISGHRACVKYSGPLVAARSARRPNHQPLRRRTGDRSRANKAPVR